MNTSDLSDDFPDARVADPALRDYGGQTSFSGPIFTVKVFEDNTLIRRALETDGDGSVLVIDGGGSVRCALVGDQLAALAVENGWNGIVVWGCVRDSAELARLNIGIKAVATHPRRSVKRNEGSSDLAVTFAGVTFEPGWWLYADADGIVVLEDEVI
ncbi:MAG: ribonuclease E activity regulator RraA [Acidimicrobiia bacterium]|nr:ribonuclease E activity regulator RraA [Acidimicrobiia bacterium]